ncbi:HTH-type transcriptional repressor CzrA [Agromyces sp. NDB4Y10]|uniref:ArsR/SmtB family transcription factor n=1 Tax=Agromyces sp. NDB4Y10 TaxID=1775951 RepID=UPI0007B312E0|nr:metalloregulator ArsR/SmtB family transcription factor [Agromyces sp. NDB4Y10]KZE92450.1 HTH-type transcriptional repressor CzrA [Agromyces sp. NDB4Y10]
MAMNLEVDRVGLAPAAMLFHALSEPNRLLILRHLLAGEHSVREMTEHLGLAQSTVSAHLACLADCGLVASRPQGRSTRWSTRHDPTLIGLLAATERLLEATGYAVVLCPTSGAASVDTAGSQVREVSV